MTARYSCGLPGRSVIVVAESEDDACDIVKAEHGVYPFEVLRIERTAHVVPEVAA